MMDLKWENDSMGNHNDDALADKLEAKWKNKLQAYLGNVLSHNTPYSFC